MIKCVYWRASVVVLTTAIAYWAPAAQAQTVDHRISVSGGIVYVSGGAANGHVESRLYMGRRTWAFAYADLYAVPAFQIGTVGFGAAAFRSERLRFLLRGGVGAGYPVIGTGVEYGRSWGGLVGVDYLLTRSNLEEGVWFVKMGIYWGR